MTRLSPLILTALCLGCATPVPVALPDGSPQKSLSAPLSTSATQVGIQRVLDAQPRGDGIPHGTDPIGGAVHVAAGKLTYSKTIWLSSAQQLIGDSPGTTILDYQGPPGTPAIGIRSYVGNGYAVRPSVSHLSIHCAPGTRAIANDASAPTVHDAVLDDLIISGGGIRFTGECYFNRFRQINFEQPTSEPCILWEGQRLVLDSVRTAPNANVPAGSQAPSALIEVHGSVTVQGQSRFEGPVAAPYLRVTALRRLARLAHADRRPLRAAPQGQLGRRGQLRHRRAMAAGDRRAGHAVGIDGRHDGVREGAGRDDGAGGRDEQGCGERR
jgi:hypothetical protein